jgi:hypothetical protein
MCGSGSGHQREGRYRKLECHYPCLHQKGAAARLRHGAELAALGNKNLIVALMFFEVYASKKSDKISKKQYN